VDIGQFGPGQVGAAVGEHGDSEDDAGVPRPFDLAPRVDIGSLVVGYSIGF
jgi:hypothetical protein